VSSDRAKSFKFVAIPGQAGQIKLFPSNNLSPDEMVHTILTELRLEEGGELIIEDGVDLYVADSSSSCYLMVSGITRYEV
jgi:hypothetical protein